MSRRFNPDRDVAEWKGGYYPYDIVKEGLIALLVVVILVVGLAVVFSSPDDPPVTLKQWATQDPIDFAQTTLCELNGMSSALATYCGNLPNPPVTPTYGAPYDTDYANSQTLGPVGLAQFAGVRIPVNTARDFVLSPLSTLPDDTTLMTDLSTWDHASTAQQSLWLEHYAQGANNLSFVNGNIVTPATDAGPVPVFINTLTQMARSGGLDQALETGQSFYSLNYTKPLLFLADGNWFASLGENRHLGGDEWGMMNETGNYPGQAWLWLYTFWYQVPPYSTSSNGDALVWGTMMLLTLGLLLVPFLPVVRSIPRWSRVYRIIWKEHYRSRT